MGKYTIELKVNVNIVIVCNRANCEEDKICRIKNNVIQLA